MTLLAVPPPAPELASLLSLATVFGCRMAKTCYGTGGMIYAVSISQASAFAKAMADGAAGAVLAAQGPRLASAATGLRELRAFVVRIRRPVRLRQACGGHLKSPISNYRLLRPSHSGSVQPGQTQSNPVKPSPTLNCWRDDGIWRKNVKIVQSVPPPDPVRRRVRRSLGVGGRLREGGSPPATAADPTQSCLVVPSRAFDFPRKRRNGAKNPKKGQFVPPPRLSLATNHSPLATTPLAQYGLIRPNTALNFARRAKWAKFA
jgi:hypothetical protein